jgi:hypothetical protein
MSELVANLLGYVYCEFEPVEESKRYPLKSQDCSNPAVAEKTRGKGMNHIAAIQRGDTSLPPLTAADYNNLGCADVWVGPCGPLEWIAAKEKFEKANCEETPGYDELSDESKVKIRANKDRFAGGGRIIRPLTLGSLGRDELKELLDKVPAEGFRIELERG